MAEIGNIDTLANGCYWHVLKRSVTVELPAMGDLPFRRHSLDLCQALAVHPCPGGRIIINYPGTGGSHDGYCGKHRKIAGLLQSGSMAAVIRMDNPGKAPYGYATWLRDRLRHVIQFALEESVTICGSHTPEIYLMGFSSGASAIASIAHEFDLVIKILLIAPIMNRKGNGSLTKLDQYRGEIAVVVGDADTVAPPSVSREFYTLAKNSKRRRLEVVPRCDHQFRGERNARILSKLAAWAFDSKEEFPSPEGGVALYSDSMSIHMIHSSASPNRDKGSMASAVFLHGRLGGLGVERPAIHCAPFFQALSVRGAEILVPEYSDLYHECAHEVENVGLGPISAAVHSSLSDIERQEGDLALIAYSFGCVIATNLLVGAGEEMFERLVLVAPVVSQSVRACWPTPVTRKPTLIIWGTHDNRMGDTSWLAEAFPNHEFAPIEGGNHLHYLLPSPMDRFDENPASIARAEQQIATAECIARFLKCAPSGDNWIIEEHADDRLIDLTEQCVAKAVTARENYWFYDQREE